MGKRRRPIQIFLGKSKPEVTNYLISGTATYAKQHEGEVAERSVRGQTREQVVKDAEERAPSGTILTRIRTTHHGIWHRSNGWRDAVPIVVLGRS